MKKRILCIITFFFMGLVGITFYFGLKFSNSDCLQHNYYSISLPKSCSSMAISKDVFISGSRGERRVGFTIPLKFFDWRWVFRHGIGRVIKLEIPIYLAGGDGSRHFISGVEISVSNRDMNDVIKDLLNEFVSGDRFVAVGEEAGFSLYEQERTKVSWQFLLPSEGGFYLRCDVNCVIYSGFNNVYLKISIPRVYVKDSKKILILVKSLVVSLSKKKDGK